MLKLQNIIPKFKNEFDEFNWGSFEHDVKDRYPYVKEDFITKYSFSYCS